MSNSIIPFLPNPARGLEVKPKPKNTMSTLETMLTEMGKTLQLCQRYAAGRSDILTIAEFAAECNVTPQQIHTALMRQPDRLTVVKSRSGRKIGIVLDEKADKYKNNRG